MRQLPTKKPPVNTKNKVIETVACVKIVTENARVEGHADLGAKTSTVAATGVSSSVGSHVSPNLITTFIAIQKTQESPNHKGRR